MYRSRDESYVTQLRHRLMLNEGTNWLVDRQWAYRYFQKYLLMDDLHLWASQQAVGYEIPMGTGPLDPDIVIVTPHVVTVDEEKQIKQLLATANKESAKLYWTFLHRLPEAEAALTSLDEGTLLTSELNILNAPLILSFGIAVKQLDLPPFTSAPFKDGTLLQIPSLIELQGEMLAKAQEALTGIER